MRNSLPIRRHVAAHADEPSALGIWAAERAGVGRHPDRDRAARGMPGGHRRGPRAWSSVGAKSIGTMYALRGIGIRVTRAGGSKVGATTREFGVPEPQVRQSVTESDNRIMTFAAGGFDAGYNAQISVDEAVHIIVSAEVHTDATDVNGLLPMSAALGTNRAQLAGLRLAEIDSRSEEHRQGSPVERVDAIGREVTRHALINTQAHPHSAHWLPATLALQTLCRPDT